ncbi:TRAP transporter small permease [Blastococcus sp. SYSU DS0619]
MSRFDSVLTKVENVLAAGSLAVAALIAIVAVILRTFFNEIIFWSEEAIIYLIIFSTFLGSVITMRHNEHVNVDIIAVFLKKRGKQVMALIGLTVFLVYLAVVGWFAWMLIFEPVSSNTVTPALGLPLWVVTLPLPIGLTLMFLRGIEIFYRTVRGQDPYPQAANDLLAAEGGAELDLEGIRTEQHPDRQTRDQEPPDQHRPEPRPRTEDGR